jgi:cephalosporin hydroxylase
VSVKPDIDVYQNLWELDQMLAVVDRLQPQRVLEVGSWQGGTLWHWLQYGGTVVSIDDGMRLASEWEKWADEADAELVLLQGMSQDPALVEKAGELGPYDFIFIDADHRYEAVRADWENFSPMIAEGGVFAFHDTQHIGDPTYGVERLWNEITAQPDVRWVHIVMTNHCGIGMLWL